MKLILALILILYLGSLPRWHYTLGGDLQNYYLPIARHLFTKETLIYPPAANLFFLTFGNEPAFVTANIIIILTLGYFYRNTPFWLIILAAGPIVLFRFDPLVMVLVVLSIKSLTREDFVGSGIFLGAAVMTKFFPVILLPYFLLVLRSKKKIIPFFLAFAIAAVTVLVAYMGLTQLSFSTVTEGLFFNLSKSVNMESVTGSILTIVTSLTNPGPHGVKFINALWVLDPLYFLGHARIFQYLPLVGLSLVYGLIFLSHRKTARFAPSICVLIILVLIVSSQVFSPQYLLWPAFLFPLLKKNNTNLFILSAALICTQIIYPLNYGELIDFFNLGINQPLFWVSVARNLLVVILTVRLFISDVLL